MNKDLLKTVSGMFNKAINKLTQDAVNDVVEQVKDTIATGTLKRLPKSEQRCPVLLPMGVLQGYEGEGMCGLRMTVIVEVEPLTGKEGGDE